MEKKGVNYFMSNYDGYLIDHLLKLWAMKGSRISLLSIILFNFSFR